MLFCSPRGHWQGLETVLIVKTQESATTSTWWIKIRNAAKYHLVHRTAPQQKMIQPQMRMVPSRETWIRKQTKILVNVQETLQHTWWWWWRWWWLCTATFSVTLVESFLRVESQAWTRKLNSGLWSCRGRLTVSTPSVPTLNLVSSEI